MEINLIVTSTDLLTDEEFVIKNGIAYLDDNTLRYIEDDGSSCIISVNGNDVSIIRNSESNSTLNLSFRDYRDCIVETEYGSFDLESYMLCCLITSEMWIIEYQLFDEVGIISHIKLQFDFSGVSFE